ncbi:hypothetical protein ACFL6K_01435 [Candidatus Latescibacterota bacterium]
MAINNINPGGPGGPLKRGPEPAKIKSESAVKPVDVDETTAKSAEAVRAENVQADTLQVSEDRKFIEKMVDTVEKMDDAPREDVVKRAAQRVSNGDYNSGEFIRNLALKLVNTE